MRIFNKLTQHQENTQPQSCKLLTNFKTIVTSPLVHYNTNLKPSGDHEDSILSPSVSSSLVDSSNELAHGSQGIDSQAKAQRKIVNSNNKSIDKEEEDACMTIEDERTEESMPSTVRKLEIELGQGTKAVSVRNSKTVQKRMHVIRQSMPQMNFKIPNIQSEEIPTAKEETKISLKNTEEVKGESVIGDVNNANKNSSNDGLKKLDLLKKKNKKQPPLPQTKGQGRPFGFTPKSQGPQKGSEGKGVRIGNQVTQQQQDKQQQQNSQQPQINLQQIPNTINLGGSTQQNLINRKKSILYPKNQAALGGQSQRKLPLRQTQINDINLKEVTMQTSSLFNISIERIMQTTPCRHGDGTALFFRTQHNSNQNNGMGLETNQNTSLNTTQQIAQLVSATIQPSEKSNFHFTPKFFKQYQTKAPSSINSSNHNLFTKEAIIDKNKSPNRENEDSNSSFEKLESQILFQEYENQYNPTAQSNKADGVIANFEMKDFATKQQTPCSKQSLLLNYSQNATDYQTQTSPQDTARQRANNSKCSTFKKESETKQQITKGAKITPYQ